jgi:hypothetical protein
MKMIITSYSRSCGYPSEFGRSSQLSFEGTDSNGSTVSLEFDNRYKDIVSAEFANVAGEVFEVEISIKRMEPKTVYKS